MKNSKKPLSFFRLPALLLALILLLTAGALTATAADDNYTTWEYDTATGILTATYPTGRTADFTRVGDLSNRLRCMPTVEYSYRNSARMDSDRLSVTASYFMANYIKLDDGTQMATKKGHQELAEMVSGEIHNGYRIYAGDSTSYYYSMSQNTLAALEALDGTGSVSYTLFELKDVHRYEIFGMSEGSWYGILLGYIFETEDGLFYADPRDLPENCLSSNAELLPKTTVSLSLTPLDEELTEIVYGLVTEISYHRHTYNSESSYDLENSIEEATVGLIFTSVIVLGILVPIAPIVLGLCLPHSKRLGRKKRWYLLAGLGFGWMALGLLLLVQMTLIL